MTNKTVQAKVYSSRYHRKRSYAPHETDFKTKHMKKPIQVILIILLFCLAIAMIASVIWPPQITQ